MRREELSTVSTVLLSLLIFLFVSETQANLLQEACSSSCGDTKNISYPFRLKSDPSGCGDYDYELSCENNKTIMEFHSGKYYVKQISYGKRIIHLVDVNIANGSCSLPNNSLTFDKIYSDGRYIGLNLNSFVSFVKCSSNISDPVYRRVDCLSGNDSHVYVIYDGTQVSDLLPSCSYISMVATPYEDVRNPSYETIMRLMESGFDLQWSVECRDCIADGSECTLTLFEQPYIYECYKSDFVPRLLEAIFSALFLLFEVVTLIARFILAPIVLFVFLIHKYRTSGKSDDNVESAISNP